MEPTTDPPIAVPAAAWMMEAMDQLGLGNRKAKAARRRQEAVSGSSITPLRSQAWMKRSGAVTMPRPVRQMRTRLYKGSMPAPYAAPS
jgi:hypothetical protein